MKKITFVVILTALFIFASNVFAYPLEFNTAGDTQGAEAVSNITGMSVADGVLSYTTNGTDPHFRINKATSLGGVTNADDAKQIEIRFATTAKSGTFHIYYTSVNPADSTYYCKPYDKTDTSEQAYANNMNSYSFSGSGSLDDFITITIDQSKFKYWKGIVNHLRIDTGSQSGVTYKIDYIRFVGEKSEIDETPEKTSTILEEEKLYGECLFFDDFENYAEGSTPVTVYYSNLGKTEAYKSDQCKAVKVVSGIAGNNTKCLELTGSGDTWKYPFYRVKYVLEDGGTYTMIADMYTDVSTVDTWCFFNGYSGTGTESDKRLRYAPSALSGLWQNVFKSQSTYDTAGFTKMNYFSFGAHGIDNYEKMYLDNIRVFFTSQEEGTATFENGGGVGDSFTVGYLTNSEITFPENTFTKEGFIFTGWKTTIDNGIYMPGEKLNVGENTFFTAVPVWGGFIPDAVTVRENSVRDTSDGVQGVRFAGYVSDTDKAKADEYGIIATRAELLGDYQLLFGESANGKGLSPDGIKYVYGAAYTKGSNDFVYANTGDAFGNDYWSEFTGSFFSAVLTGIPESAYDEILVVRPYAKFGDVYTYGNEIRKSARAFAQVEYDGGSDLGYVSDILEVTTNPESKSVCFFGDSITHDGKYIKELCQTYLNSDEDVRYEFYNVGISGDTAVRALKRVDDDLLYYNPDIVIMMFGMNDIDRTLYSKVECDEATEAKRKAKLDEYEASMKAIVEKLLAKNIEVILCTPTPYDDSSMTDNGINTGLGKCAEIVRALAAEKNLNLVDHFENMYELRSLKYWNSDHIHPSPLGQHVIAQSIMYSLGYTDKMELTTAMTSFSDYNNKRHTVSYNLQMVAMVDRDLRDAGFKTLEAKKAKALKLQAEQTNDHFRWIYQNYMDNIENAYEMREEAIRATMETSFRH